MPPTDPEQEGYELLYPWVVCKSNGGPFDDDGFAAGFRCGGINAKLNTQIADKLVEEVDPRDLDQLDLIAMHHEYGMTVTLNEEDPTDWAVVVFEKMT